MCDDVVYGRVLCEFVFYFEKSGPCLCVYIPCWFFGLGARDFVCAVMRPFLLASLWSCVIVEKGAMMSLFCIVSSSMVRVLALGWPGSSHQHGVYTPDRTTTPHPK
jgi:hypothetical protein